MKEKRDEREFIVWLRSPYQVQIQHQSLSDTMSHQRVESRAHTDTHTFRTGRSTLQWSKL